MSGNFKNDILNGEFIENDIRLSEAIREAIEDIKTIQKVPLNKKGDMEKRRFLARYTEVAELLGVSFTVEHLLPALLEIVSVLVFFNYIFLLSSNQTTKMVMTEASLS